MQIHGLYFPNLLVANDATWGDFTASLDTNVLESNRKAIAQSLRGTRHTIGLSSAFIQYLCECVQQTANRSLFF